MGRKHPKLETKISNNTGVAAADWSPSRAWVNFPLNTTNPEASSWALERIWKRARSLYCNCPEVRHAVQTLAMMVGTLQCRPCSSDEKWNELAREAFIKRTGNAALFDQNGIMNFSQIQLWLERRAIVDGDALCVLSTAPDGGGQIALYSAPQITGTGDYKDGNASGVVKDARGRVKGYQVWDYSEKKPFFAAANRAVLYRHNPEPSSPRGASELTSAICTCQDLVELVSASKASAKLAAMFGLIETTDAAAKSSLSDLAALRNPARVSGAGAAQGSAQTPAPPALGVRVGETTAISLSPGKHLEILADNRPSQQVQEFIKKLVSSIAYAVGLDPCVLFDSGDMSSSAARFIIAKSRDIVAQRLQDRISLCNKIYQFVLSCEVRAGRLPKCPAPDWDAVKWISNSFWSIDLQRDAKTAMELISRGLCSADDYCLQAFGRTAEEIFASNLHTISHNMKRAQDAGVPYHAVAAPAAGSTYTPPENVEPTPQEHPADDDGMIND